MKSILLLAGAAMALSACVIVISDTEDDYGRTDFAAYGEATTQTLQPFTGMSASAGTDVTVLYGTEYSISLDEVAAERSTYSLKDGSLKITCKRPCGNGRRGHIEVTTPELTAIAVSSGADVKILDGLRDVDDLTVAVSSGGCLDARKLKADSLTVSASSGGSAKVYASDAINGSASSGGSVKYWGSPEQVSVSKSSGGSIRKAN